VCMCVHVCVCMQMASLEISHVKRITHGQKTATFALPTGKKKSRGAEFEDRSFSVVTGSRSLDLVAPSSIVAQVDVCRSVLQSVAVC